MDTRASEPELQRLMSAGLNGDANAHRTLLVLVSGRLRAYFKARLVRAGYGAIETEDLVQEVLIAVHTRRHTYDSSQPFTPWLYGIARYKLLDYFRRSRASTGNVPLEHAEEVIAHTMSTLWRAGSTWPTMLGQLPPKMSRAIRYVKLEGLTVSEAAARSGMSASAIKVSVHRGLKALARLFAKESPR